MSDLGEELRLAIGEFVRQVRQLATMPAGQAAVLGYLDRGGDLSIADLARSEQVKHQSMARTVGLLVEAGLAELGSASHDRRQVVVSITDLGKARLEEQRRARAAWIAARMDVLDAEEKELLARVPGLMRKLSGP
jgi:DNA-binding MarR family transcriptional regulator